VKLLLSYSFQFVQNIEPKKDLDGKIMEYSPQSLYDGKETNKLNSYGEGTFCKFCISTFEWSGVSGVYAFFSDSVLIYIGQAIDFAQRINQGYGSISPRNCYVGGQETNCRINQAILQERKSGHSIELYFFPTQNYDYVETELIQHFKPRWNISKNNDYFENERQARFNHQSQNKEYSTNRNGITGNPNIDFVREYIKNLILKAKAKGFHELTLQSGDIHKALSMDNAMPSVCSAMHTVPIPCEYIVIRQSPSGKSSKLIIKYLF